MDADVEPAIQPIPVSFSSKVNRFPLDNLRTDTASFAMHPRTMENDFGPFRKSHLSPVQNGLRGFSQPASPGFAQEATPTFSQQVLSNSSSSSLFNAASPKRHNALKGTQDGERVVADNARNNEKVENARNNEKVEHVSTNGNPSTLLCTGKLVNKREEDRSQTPPPSTQGSWWASKLTKHTEQPKFLQIGGLSPKFTQGSGLSPMFSQGQTNTEAQPRGREMKCNGSLSALDEMAHASTTPAHTIHGSLCNEC